MTLYFHFKLKQILEAKGINQKVLAQMTGIREATISELVTDKRGAYNKEHLLKVMKALNITELSEILEVKSKS
jgi:putative transcriptional regulator